MELIRHSATAARAVRSVAIRCARNGDRLQLHYRVDAPKSLLIRDGRPVRTDELWQHTCFEAFVVGSGPDYREFNFAPSGAWAAYAFDDYRAGMRDSEAAPVISWGGGELTAEVGVDLPGDWRLNLTAVIEETDGTKSYWALAHPHGPPDFHYPACFVLELPAAD